MPGVGCQRSVAAACRDRLSTRVAKGLAGRFCPVRGPAVLPAVVNVDAGGSAVFSVSIFLRFWSGLPRLGVAAVAGQCVQILRLV